LSVAETVCPSVRGAEGIRVAAVLAGSGVATAALVGLAAGVGWEGLGLGALSPSAAGALALVAAAGDVAARRFRWARPVAVGRQVPQLWGRLFGARVAALLYGARLGVGPLTILTSWAWWAALVVGASLGPWPSAAVGAGFALVRAAVTLVAATGVATGDAMRRRTARVLAADGLVAWSSVALLVGVAGMSAAW
jgi:hypothetical protein